MVLDKLPLSFDTALGIALGAVSVWYIWYSQEDSIDKPTPILDTKRKFDKDDLAAFHGNDGRLCYVATPSCKVYNVSKDSDKFLGKGGKMISEELDAGLYEHVGTFIPCRNFTIEELREFNGKDGKPVYVCARNVIYDVDPSFYGPGGAYEVMAGRDATRALALYSLDVKDVDNTRIDDLSKTDLNTLDEWVSIFQTKYKVVGNLIPSPVKPTPESFLNRSRQQVELAHKIALSHDTLLFRFKLPTTDMRLGLPIGKHIKFWCPNPTPSVEGHWNGQQDSESKNSEIERKYTPTSLDCHLGHFDVVIKVYKSGVVERFPDGGKMSQYMESLEVGDLMHVAGPFGLVEYKGRGTFNIKRKDIKCRSVGMIAGGTGITPMLQIITAIMQDEEDPTKISLLYANQTEKDILLREKLEEMQSKYPDRLSVWYTLDRPSETWTYSTGFVTEAMIQEHLPPPADDCLVLMCGPPPMIKFACKMNLDKLGYASSSQVEF